MMTPSVLLSEEQVRDRIAEMAEQIRADYGDVPLHVIGILKGCYPFVADLTRELTGDVRVEFMKVSSYGFESSTTGDVKVLYDSGDSLEGKHVLVVEDIIDTGLTIQHLRDLLLARGPAVLKVAALLSKTRAKGLDVDVEYVGFHIPDQFVVGFGLDYAERYRNLPFVGVLPQDALSS